MPPYADLLPDLERIIREAGSVARRMQAGTPRKIKPDGSIVTPADCKVEEFLRAELSNLLDAGIYGEEMDSTPETEAGLWCIDPIDGTSNYAFGSPLWGVSIGLVRKEQAILGAIYLPVLDELFLGASGCGATLNGQPIAPIPPGPIRPEELLSCPDRILRVVDPSSLPGKVRHTGAFVIDGAYTAAQRFRGLIGLREQLYDVAACICIGVEVGADIRYADGSPMLLEPLKSPRAKITKPWLIVPRDSGLVIN